MFFEGEGWEVLVVVEADVGIVRPGVADGSGIFDGGVEGDAVALEGGGCVLIDAIGSGDGEAGEG
jgi:hypothetical protein